MSLEQQGVKALRVALFIRQHELRRRVARLQRATGQSGGGQSRRFRVHHAQRRLPDDLTAILRSSIIQFLRCFTRAPCICHFGRVHKLIAGLFPSVRYCAVQPPSTVRILPVINGFSSSAITACAASSVVPIRPIGCKPANQSRWALSVRASPTMRSIIGVWIVPKATAFTRPPCFANSRAAARVKPFTACLEAV